MAIGDPLRRAFNRFARKSLESGTPGVEGQPKPGPWYIIGQNEGWLPPEWGRNINFWQLDQDPLPGGSNAIVQACVAAYAHTIAMCPGDHWRGLPNGGRERVTTSALSRILRKPNDYQSRSDFILNLARDLYLDGNTYALATRNDRFEVSALHPFNPKMSRSIVVGGEIFYELAGNNIVEQDRESFGFSRLGRPGVIAPARDVLHVKLEANQSEPLVGIPPLRHAAAAITAQNVIGSQLISLFSNLSRPAGVIETETGLTRQQTEEFRARFDEAWHGRIDNLSSGPPVLTHGLKFHGISMSAKDTELAASAKLTQDQIYMVFGVPPAILGMTDKGSFASTEALMQFWLSGGLGFAMNHIEVAIDQYFGLRGWPDEYTEFDVSALLRPNKKDRIDAYARGVQGGIYAPNEARAAEDLPAMPFGDEPRVQQQVVPLSAWAEAPPSTPRPNAPEAPPPAANEENEDEDEDEDEDGDGDGSQKSLRGSFEDGIDGFALGA